MNYYMPMALSVNCLICISITFEMTCAIKCFIHNLKYLYMYMMAQCQRQSCEFELLLLQGPEVG